MAHSVAQIRVRRVECAGTHQPVRLSSFSRDSGHSSSVDYTGAGITRSVADTGKAADGEVHVGELGFRQDEQEGLEKDHGLAEAGVEIEMAFAKLVPGSGAPCPPRHTQFIHSIGKVVVQGVQQLLEGNDLLQKLRMAGKKDAAQEAAGPGGALAMLGLEIGGIQRGEIGEKTEVATALTNRMKDSGDAQYHFGTQLGRDQNSVKGPNAEPPVVEIECFVQRNAKS